MPLTITSNDITQLRITKIQQAKERGLITESEAVNEYSMIIQEEVNAIVKLVNLISNKEQPE